MTAILPSILERKTLSKVWGGSALRDVLGLELASDRVGETWELYDRADGSSVLRDRDATLRDWMSSDADAILGGGVEPAPGGYFPLLLKYIDASDVLSVQVHPDREQAERAGDGPKGEAWIVLGARDDARIIRGFKNGVTAEDVAAAVDSPAIEELLHEFTPRVGDAIEVPPGMVHAIGPGVVLFEVQQNSDLTYRFWDWGRGRELHVGDGLDALRMHPSEPETRAPESIDADNELLLDGPAFRVRRSRMESPASLGTEGSFKALSVLSGRGTLGWRSGGDHPPLMLVPGDTVLVPACVEVVFISPIGSLELLSVGPGAGS